MTQSCPCSRTFKKRSAWTFWQLPHPASRDPDPVCPACGPRSDVRAGAAERGGVGLDARPAPAGRHQAPPALPRARPPTLLPLAMAGTHAGVSAVPASSQAPAPVQPRGTRRGSDATRLHVPACARPAPLPCIVLSQAPVTAETADPARPPCETAPLPARGCSGRLARPGGLWGLGFMVQGLWLWGLRRRCGAPRR